MHPTRQSSALSSHCLISAWLAHKAIALKFLTTIGSLSVTAALFLSQSSSAQSNSTGSTAETISPFCETSLANFNVYSGIPDPSVLSAAIDQGGDLNQPCDVLGQQWLPLNLLLSMDASLAQQLIEKGVDVNAQDGEGNTPLHAVGGSVENARSLLQKGAQVNARNQSGIAPLHNTYGQKTAAVMALLIEQGADVNAQSEEQLTPLHFAYNSAEGASIADLLIRNGADVNARSSQNFTSLHYAIANTDVAKRLIEAGADLTLQNREGAAIHASSLTPAVLQLLFGQAVDVNLRNADGQTPLHRHRFNRSLVEMLLTHGAKVNAQDDEGKTPLFDVNIEVARLLVEAGADLNLQDKSGRTALHQAVLEEQSFFGPELVALFLRHQVRTDLKDNQGETALDIAKRLDKSQIVNLLEQHSVTQGNSDLAGAAVANNLRQLLEFLNEQNWGAADRETRRLLSGEDYPYGPNIATVPLNLIRAIDEAWLAASDGRFGLSVQAKIWEAAVAAHPNDRDAAVNDFRDRVGWKLTAPRSEVDFISSDWLNESELNYSLQAPTGHLPWAGVSDASVQGLLVETVNGCGSCTTDAMQLRNERFYNYLPDLFSRVQVALNTSVPIAQAWRSPTLLHQINLTALYPSGSSVRPTTQAISPNSQTLAVASRSSSRSALALWNLATGTRRITLLKPEAGVPEATVIAFSANSQQLFAGLSNGNIQVWETSQGKSLRSWAAHPGGVKAIALSSDGNTVVSGGGTSLKVWDSTGRLLRTLPLSAGESQPSAIQSVQISPDNQRLAVATGRTIQLWNIGTGQLIKVAVSTIAQNQATFGPSLPQAMAFSPDSRYLAALDTDNSIKLWNTSSGARVITLRQHQHPVQALAFSPDGQTLISRDANQSVLFWNLSTFQSDRSISVASGNAPDPVDTSDAVATPQPIILSPDGQTFAVLLTSTDFPQSRFAVDLRAVVTGDRLVMMTNGPGAGIGEVLTIPFERPRDRTQIMEDPVCVDRASSTSSEGAFFGQFLSGACGQLRLLLRLLHSHRAAKHVHAAVKGVVASFLGQNFYRCCLV